MPIDVKLDFPGLASARGRVLWQIPDDDHLPELLMVILPSNCLVAAPLAAEDNLENATWEDAEWQ